LAIKLDPRLVEPMVAVAKGETPAAEAPAEATAEAKTETVAAE
jgi:hypothetical protein